MARLREHAAGPLQSGDWPRWLLGFPSPGTSGGLAEFWRWRERKAAWRVANRPDLTGHEFLALALAERSRRADLRV